MISLALFVASFLITATTQNIFVIYAMRVLQGVLSGFAVVAKRAFLWMFMKEKSENIISAS
jgi:MFS family permease